MARMTRRAMVRLGLGAAALGWAGAHSARAGGAAPAPPAQGGAQAAGPPATDGPLPPPADFGLPVIGKVKVRPTAAIAASPLGVGCEVLDRKLWDPQKIYPYLANLGAKWARCQTGWARTEQARGEFDFGWLDDLVDNLLRLGVQPWFNLGYGNRLYTPADDEYAVGWAPVFSDEARAGWLRYTQRVAERFAGRVKHWEIWNEPNITGFWKPEKPNPRDYVELVRITAPEIRNRVPGAVIIGCALAGVGTDYLKGCLAAGLADLVDKVSYHPYRTAPEAGYEKDVAALRAALAATGKNIGLWQGENGAPSAKGGAGALAAEEWNEARQARWCLRRLLNDLRLGIEFTSYFLIVDLVGYRGSTNYKGLLRGTSYTPKPAFFAYRHLANLFDAETKRADLAVGVEDAEADKIIAAAFLRKGRPIYAYWYPSNLMKDWTVRKVALRAAAGAGAPLEKPVLVDLLSGQAYRLDAAKREGDAWVFPGLPLADYPLLVTDAAVLEA
ncbi:MAG: beta-glucosidase [Planctomycetes bacterium]|nr:beta-glucosidase [Planctomycetota bacterium]